MLTTTPSQEQSLLRVPHELLCRNFRPASKGITREHDYVVPALRDLTSAVENGASTQANTLESLDKMLERMKTIKHRLETLNRRDKRHLDKSGQRLRHLQDVYGIKDMGDPRYEAWAKIRLNRLLVDHLMREGYTDTAKRLTESTGVSDLVDLGIFEQCNQVTSKLEVGELTAALQWCSENKLLLKKQRKTELEFQLRLQQYIEFVKKRDLVRARKHAMQYLSPASSEQGELAKHAAAMLVFQPSTEKEPYA
ncbi:GID complex subunit containing RING finger motif, partial [Ascosphaera atra]